MGRELMPWAQDAAHSFYLKHGDGNCSCFISAPCSSCAHEGNPINLECADDAWGEPHEVMTLEAEANLVQFINNLVAKHLAEMAAGIRYVSKPASEGGA